MKVNFRYYHTAVLFYLTKLPSNLQNFLQVAAEAPSWTNVKEAMAAMVLQQALGASGKVKYGSGQGILHKATANIGGTFAVSGLNFAYSDSALMGAFIASEADSAGKVHTLYS